MSQSAVQSTLQVEIESRQTLDAIEYAIRSIDVSRSPYGASACHVAQITAGCQAATRVLGQFVAQDHGTLRLLKTARKTAREQAKAATVARKAAGNAQQIRLALAA